MLRRIRAGRVFRQNGRGGRVLVAGQPQGAAVVVQPADQLLDVVGVFLPEQLEEDPRLVVGPFDRLEEPEQRALRVARDVIAHSLGREADPGQRILELRRLLIGGLQPLQHRVDAGGGHLGRRLQLQERGAERADLLAGQAEQPPDRAGPVGDVEQPGRRGVHVVRQMVEGAGEVHGALLPQVEDRAQPGHRRARLLAAQIERHRHLRGVLREALQLGARDAGLPRRGHDRGQPLGGDGDPRRHLAHGLAHRLERLGRREVHHLAHVGHGGLEADGSADGAHQGPRDRIADPHGLDQLAAGLAPVRARLVASTAQPLETTPLRQRGVEAPLMLRESLHALAGLPHGRAVAVQLALLLRQSLGEALCLAASLLELLAQLAGGLRGGVERAAERRRAHPGLARGRRGAAHLRRQPPDRLGSRGAGLESIDFLPQVVDASYTRTHARREGGLTNQTDADADKEVLHSLSSQLGVGEIVPRVPAAAGNGMALRRPPLRSLLRAGCRHRPGVPAHGWRVCLRLVGPCSLARPHHLGGVGRPPEHVGQLHLPHRGDRRGEHVGDDPHGAAQVGGGRQTADRTADDYSPWATRFNEARP